MKTILAWQPGGGGVAAGHLEGHGEDGQRGSRGGDGGGGARRSVLETFDFTCRDGLPRGCPRARDRASSRKYNIERRVVRDSFRIRRQRCFGHGRLEGDINIGLRDVLLAALAPGVTLHVGDLELFHVGHGERRSTRREEGIAELLGGLLASLAREVDLALGVAQPALASISLAKP